MIFLKDFPLVPRETLTFLLRMAVLVQSRHGFSPSPHIDASIRGMPQHFEDLRITGCDPFHVAPILSMRDHAQLKPLLQ